MLHLFPNKEKGEGVMIEVTITKEIVDFVEEHKNREKYDFLFTPDFSVEEGSVWHLEGVSEEKEMVLLYRGDVSFSLPSHLVPQESVNKFIEELDEKRMCEEFREEFLNNVDWAAYRIETARQIAFICLKKSLDKEVLPNYRKMMEFSIQLTDTLIKELQRFRKDEDEKKDLQEMA